MTFHDEYDPELHGDREAPAAQRHYTLALTVVLVTVPLLIWWALS